MPTRVYVPELDRNLVFPDDMSDEERRDAIYRNFPELKPTEPEPEPEPDRGYFGMPGAQEGLLDDEAVVDELESSVPDDPEFGNADALGLGLRMGGAEMGETVGTTLKVAGKQMDPDPRIREQLRLLVEPKLTMEELAAIQQQGPRPRPMFPTNQEIQQALEEKRKRLAEEELARLRQEQTFRPPDISTPVEELGESVESYWEQARKDLEKEIPEELRKPLVERPENLGDPRWLILNVSRMVPSLMASVVPGLTAQKFLKMGRLASSLVGGFSGGWLEGAPVYREILEKGGSHEEALAGAAMMTLASTALNAISVERFLRAPAETIGGKFAQKTVRGLFEAITEYLEEPAQVWIMYEGGYITPEEAVNQLLNGLDVLAPAGIIGFLFPGAGRRMRQAASGTPTGAPEDDSGATSPPGTPEAEETETPPAEPPAGEEGLDSEQKAAILHQEQVKDLRDFMDDERPAEEILGERKQTLQEARQTLEEAVQSGDLEAVNAAMERAMDAGMNLDEVEQIVDSIQGEDVPRVTKSVQPEGEYDETLLDMPETPQEIAQVLPGLPRRVYAAMAEIASSDGRTAEKEQLQELRQRILETGEAPEEAMRALWGPELADAPRELREALAGDMAVPEVPPVPAPGQEGTVQPEKAPGRREAPIPVETAEDIDQAAAHIEPNITLEKAQAGNFRKGYIKLNGFNIALETARGTIRAGKDENGNPWEVLMPAHYGEIQRTEGADGDGVDVYLGQSPESKQIYVVDQIDPKTGKFDEHKVLMAFPDQETAMDTYVRGFSDGSGQSRMGAVTPMTVAQFRQWLKNGNTKKPVAYRQPKPEKKARRPAQRGALKPVDNKRDDLLAAIAKLGGLSREEAEAQGIDPAEFKRRGWGIRYVFAKKGRSFDDMALVLSEQGYPVLNENGQYDPNVLLEVLSRALRGDSVWSMEGEAYQAELAQRDRDEFERQREPEIPEEVADVLAMKTDNLDETTVDLTEALARATSILGESRVEAILERASIEGENLSSQEYENLVLTRLEEAIHENDQKVTQGDQPGEPGDGFRLEPVEVRQRKEQKPVSQGDLFGGKSETAQAVKDAEEARKAKEREAPPVEAGEGTLFDGSAKQVDIEDVANNIVTLNQFINNEIKKIRETDSDVSVSEARNMVSVEPWFDSLVEAVKRGEKLSRSVLDSAYKERPGFINLLRQAQEAHGTQSIPENYLTPDVRRKNKEYENKIREGNKRAKEAAKSGKEIRLYRGEAPGNIRFDPHGKGQGQFWTTDKEMAESFAKGGRLLTARYKPGTRRLVLVEGNQVNDEGVNTLKTILGEGRGESVASQIRKGTDTESVLTAEDYQKIKAAGYQAVAGSNIEGATEYVLDQDAIEQQEAPVNNIAQRSEETDLSAQQPKPDYETRKAEQLSLFSALKDLDQVRKDTGSMVANAVTRDFKGEGVASLLGRKIRSHRDLAALAQIYRNPHFETFRVFFLNEDMEIVGQNAISARLPGYTTSFFGEGGKGATKAEDIQLFKEQMKKVGAKYFWVLHNHPSGDPTPSDGDRNVTGWIAAHIPGFVGHVVINQDRYSYIAVDGAAKLPNNKINARMKEALFPIETKKFAGKYYYDVKKNPTVPHPLLGTKVSNQEELAELAKSVQSNPDYIVLIGTNRKGTRGIMEVSPKEFSMETKRDRMKVLAAVRKFARQTGSISIFAANVPVKYREWAETGVFYKLFQDVVLQNGTSIYSYMKTTYRAVMGKLQKGYSKPFMEDKNPYDAGRKVRLTEYQPPELPEPRYKKDSKGNVVKDAADRPMYDFGGMFVVHATDEESSTDIARNGYRVVGDGYYGEAVSFTPNAEYADQFGDIVTVAEIKLGAKILDQGNEKDARVIAEVMSDPKLVPVNPKPGQRTWRDEFLKRGIDGLYDAGAGDLFIFNPKAVEYQYRYDIEGNKLIDDLGDIEREDLIVLHNLGEGQLKAADEVGGLVVPSIAVTRAAQEFNSFGEITLVGPSDIVDPKDPRNRMYAGDVYSPTFPTKRYRYRQKQFDALWDKVRVEVAELMGTHPNLSVSAVYQRIEEKLKLYGDYEWLKLDNANSYMDYPIEALLYAYLKQGGQDIKLPMKISDGWSRFANTKEVRKLFSTFKKNGVETITEGSEEHKQITEAVKQYFSREYSDIEVDVEKIMGDMLDKDTGLLSFARTNALARDYNDYRNGRDRILDSAKMTRLLKKGLKQAGGVESYNQWIDDLFKEVTGDPYVQDGRKKLPWTAENILKVMTKNGIVSANEGMFFGLGEAQALSHPKITDLQEAKNRKWAIVSRKQRDAMTEGSKKRFFDLSDKIGRYYDGTNPFSKLDDLSKSIGRYFRGRHTYANMRNQLTRHGFKGVPKYLVEEAMEVANKSMYLPVEFFETKPQRVVSIGEFSGAVVPRGVSQETLEILKKNGITDIRYYKKLDPEGRKRAIAKFKDLMFSRRLYRRDSSKPADHDFIVPETPEFEDNTTGDLGYSPRSAEDIGIEQLPIRLTVGRVFAPHKGFGIMHLYEEGLANRRRAVPEYTDDPAENYARHVAMIARSFNEIYTEDNKIIFRSARTREALVTEVHFDKESGTEYYSVVSLMPSQHSIWGDSVWRAGRASSPADRTPKPASPTPSPGQQSGQPGRESLGNAKTEYFDIKLERKKRQDKEKAKQEAKNRKVPVRYKKRRRIYRPKDVQESYAFLFPRPKHTSTADARAEAVSVLGEDVIARHEKSGALVFYDSVEDSLKDKDMSDLAKGFLKGEISNGTDGQLNGFHDRRARGGKGKVFIISRNTAKGKVAGVILHELGVHYGLKKMLGQKLYDRVVENMHRMRKQGNLAVIDAYEDIPSDTDPSMVDEEAIAYLVARKGNQKMPLVKRIIAAIRQFMYRLGVIKKLSVEDVVNLARASVARTIEDSAYVGEQDIAYSKESPWYHSAVLRAVRNLKQNKGSPAQMLSMIMKSPGVKKEEIDWIGLPQFLEGKKSVTKKELNDFVSRNQVQVNEVIRGEKSRWIYYQGTWRQVEPDYDFLEHEAREIWLEDAKQKIAKDDGIDVSKVDEDEAMELAMNRAEEAYWETAPSIREDEIVFKGKIYRYNLETNFDEEVILYTTDTSQRSVSLDNVDDAMIKSIIIKDLEEFLGVDSLDEEATMFDQYVFDSNYKEGSYRELLLILPLEKDAYVRSHFSETNVVAHVRFTERTDDNGNEILHIEEIQSDWHQQGRKFGYKQGEADQDSKVKAPDAPFKTSWPLLVIKRMIRYAAENDFDAITWSTGKQQSLVQGYGLRKEIVELYARKKGELYDLDAVGVEEDSGREALARGIRESELKLYISENLANRVVRGLKDKNQIVLQDLVSEYVGSPGMVKFYDFMVPSAVKKYVKKWGGKVGETTINEERVNHLVITDEMRDAAMKGQPLFAKSKQKGAGLSALSARKEAEKIFGKAIRQHVDQGSLRFFNTLDEALNDPSVSQETNDYIRDQSDGFTISGFLDRKARDGKGAVFIIAGNVGEGDLQRILLHELGAHYGLKQMLGPELYRRTKKNIRRMLREGNEAVRKAYTRVPEDTPEAAVDDEAIAYLVEDENNHRMPLVKRVLSAIRRFLFRIGITRRINAQDIAGMARAAVNVSAREEVIVTGYPPANFSKASLGDRTIEENGRIVIHKRTSTFKNPSLISMFRSPNRVAKRFPLFRPVLLWAKQSSRTQERLREAFRSRLQHVERVLRRSGNYAENKRILMEIRLQADMAQKEPTVDEMKAMGASEDVITAYKLIRSAYDKALSLANQVRELRDKEPVNKRTGYVPHFFHSFFVVVDGEIATSTHTLHQAKTMAKVAVKNGAKKVAIIPKEFQFPGGEIQAAVIGDIEYFKAAQKLKKDFELSPEQAEEILNNIVRMRTRSRFVGNFMQRKGAPGWEKDLDWVDRHYFNMISRYVALDGFKRKAISYFERGLGPKSNFHGWGRFGDEHRGLAGYVKRYINDVNGVPTWLEDLINNSLDRTFLGQWFGKYLGERYAVQLATMTTNAVAIFKLGLLNASAAMVNGTQFLAVNAKLGEKYTGIGMLRAGKVFIVRGARFVGINTKAVKELGVLKKAGLDVQMGLESGAGYSRASQMGKLFQASMIFFRFMEQYLRATAILGAYQKGLDAGLNQDTALLYAEQINDETNFDYGIADTPGFIRQTGPVGQVLFQFKKFVVKFMEFMGGLGWKPSTFKAAQHIRFWIPFMLLAGWYGIPGAEILVNMIKYFTGDDPELELKAWLMKWAGDDPQRQAVAETVSYGILSRLGIDVSRRVGAGDFIPSDIDDLYGPTISTVLRAVPLAFEANWAESVRAISPSLGNPIVAMKDEEIVSPWDRNRQITTLSPAARIKKAAGFRPLEEAKQVDAKRAIVYLERKRKKQEKEAIDDYLKINEEWKEAGRPREGRLWDQRKAARKRLRELKISNRRVVEERRRKHTTRVDRAMKNVPRKERREYKNIQRFANN